MERLYTDERVEELTSKIDSINSTLDELEKKDDVIQYLKLIKSRNVRDFVYMSKKRDDYYDELMDIKCRRQMLCSHNAILSIKENEENFEYKCLECGLSFPNNNVRKQLINIDIPLTKDTLDEINRRYLELKDSFELPKIKSIIEDEFGVGKQKRMQYYNKKH